MTTHSQKKLDDGELIAFRNRFHLPLTDEQALNLEFLQPGADSAEMRYLHAQRATTGRLPAPAPNQCATVPVPPPWRSTPSSP